MNNSKLRVLFICTGIGTINRGIESFFLEAFNGLKHQEGVTIKLLKGSAATGSDEKQIFLIHRTSKITELVGSVTGRTPYAVEQWSSFPAVVKEVKSFKPHVIFSSEANIFYLLNRFRSMIGVPFRLLFSNGGPCEPPFNRFDFVHQVAPYYQQVAIDSGEDKNRHIMVPYGIHVPEGDGIITKEEKTALRQKLNLPLNRPILISVGWISASLKRMDYTINEVAAIPEGRRPYLVLLGNIDHTSEPILELARTKLGPDNYTIRSVPYQQVPDYYKASDLFVLSSLQEGFGRVFLEAMMYNLPVIAHHHPVMQYVIGNAGILANLEKPGNLARTLQEVMIQTPELENGRAYVRKKFDWKALAPQYTQMFHQVASTQPSLLEQNVQL